MNAPLHKTSQCIFSFSPDDKHLAIALTTKRLEAANVAEFKQAIDQIWKPDIENVTVECTPLEFIDSSGIGALLSLQRRTRGQRAVTIKNPKPAVISVIELLRLHRIFNLENF